MEEPSTIVRGENVLAQNDEPQLDLFDYRAERDDGLDAALWGRRHRRRDLAQSAALSPEDATIVPLVLSLARLAAQRDARLIVQALLQARD